MPFKFWRPKKLSEKQVTAFWRDVDAGKRVRKPLLPTIRKRQVIAVSQTVLATVRRFSSVDALQNYLNLNKKIVGTIMAKKPKHFELHPVQILAVDKAGLRLLERVYPNPTVNDFIIRSLPPSRYYKRFLDKLKKKGVGLNDATQIIRQASNEVRDFSCRLWDCNRDNTLVLDVDKERQKALFALVDLGGSKSE